MYHHFSDKRALHAEAFLRALTDYQAGFVEVLHESDRAETGVRDAVRYHLRITANRDAAALLVGERPSGPGAAERLAEQNRGFFKSVLRWWHVHTGYGAVRELDSALLYSLWLGASLEYCRHWLAGRNSMFPGKAAEPRSVADELASAAWTTLKAG